MSAQLNAISVHDNTRAMMAGELPFMFKHNQHGCKSFQLK